MTLRSAFVGGAGCLVSVSLDDVQEFSRTMKAGSSASYVGGDTRTYTVVVDQSGVVALLVDHDSGDPHTWDISITPPSVGGSAGLADVTSDIWNVGTTIDSLGDGFTVDALSSGQPYTPNPYSYDTAPANSLGVHVVFGGA